MKLTQSPSLYLNHFMLSTLLRRTRDFILSTVIFSSATYGYLYYRSTKNKKQYLQALQSDTLKDASRLSNDSFGISWGFQADDTIMSRIDSGDLLFIRFQCQECIETSSMLKCYLNTFHHLQEEFQSVGTTYRDESGLYVLYNQFGQTKIRSYCEFVSLPYIKSLTLQKRSKNAAKTHLNLRKELDFDKVIPQSLNEYLARISKLLGKKWTPKRIQDLLSGEQQINIRTETNNTLRSL